MKKWKILNNDTKVDSVTAIITALYKNREISDSEIQSFLSPNIESVTFSSVGIDLQEVKKTIERIRVAISSNQGIVIYGDYDVDGICGTAILWETIYSFYKNVHPYIPHRVDEGYGLSVSGIENIISLTPNVGLIITVDNGIVANKSVAYANSRGIDVIITDHHVKGEKLPDAFSFVHTTKLCGTGVAYLLAQEISKKIQNSEFKIQNSLELVALATVADLVPLNNENRMLLKLGLKELQKTKRPGLIELFLEAGIKKNEVDVYHIGHIIAPRLNATGRISHAMDALRLICTTDLSRAKLLAAMLSKTNKERQVMTFDSAAHAIDSIHNSEFKIQNLILVSDESFDQGVIGLIASRLVEEFYKPSIAVSVGKDISKGSARSIPGVNIIELIRSIPKYLKEAGGHPMAAGFSIETKNLEKFKQALIEKANEVIHKDLFEKILKIDMEIGFNLITMELYSELQKLSPFGMGNPAPVFSTKGVTIASINPVGKNKEHMQIMFEKDAVFLKGILFRFDKDLDLSVGKLVDIAYSIDKNEWQDKVSMQLRIRDLLPFGSRST